MQTLQRRQEEPQNLLHRQRHGPWRRTPTNNWREWRKLSKCSSPRSPSSCASTASREGSMRTVVTSSTSRRMSRGLPLACPDSTLISPSSSSAAKGQRRNHTKTSCRETTKSTKHVITLCSFSSFQPPADTHASDDGYEYHRTRVRSDSYTMYHFLLVWRIHDDVFDALQRTECES